MNIFVIILINNNIVSSSTINGEKLDMSGLGMSTHSHLSTNPFGKLAPSPQPTNSQFSPNLFSGLSNVNLQLHGLTSYAGLPATSFIPRRKDNQGGNCEVSLH